MSQFDHQATVHPKTVTEVSQRGPLKQPRKPYERTGHTTALTHIKVDPRVWDAALRACAGDPHRIEVINETHVEIHNDPDWRKH